MKCFDCGIYRAPPIVIPNQYGRVSVAYRDGDDLAVVQQLYDCTPRDGVDVAVLLGILNTTSSSTRRWPPPGRSRTRRCRGTPAHRRHAHRPGPRNRRPRSLRHADHKGALAPQLHLEPRGRRLAAIHALRVRAGHVFVPALLDDLPRIVAIVRHSPGGVDHAGSGDLVLKHGAPTMEGQPPRVHAAHVEHGERVGTIDPLADGEPSARRQHLTQPWAPRSEEHTSELQSLAYLVCRLLLEKKKNPQLCI